MLGFGAATLGLEPQRLEPNQEGGTPRGVEFPEEWNSRGVEPQKGEWNSQRSGIPLVPGGKTHRKVEFLASRSEIQVAGEFLKSKIRAQILFYIYGLFSFG